MPITLKKIAQPQYPYQELLNAALDALERGEPLVAADLFYQAWNLGSWEAIDILFSQEDYQLLTKSAAETQRVEPLQALDDTPDTQFRMGLCYSAGIEPYTRSNEEAFACFKRAAEQGHLSAQLGLALMYDEGRAGLDLGSPAARHKKAIFWYEKAASQGFAAAQYNLALMYHRGLAGLDLGSQAARDKKAVFWYEKAASQGFVIAQSVLAWMYFNERAGLDLGSQAARDKKAVFWYEKAAEKGYANAQNDLAVMYLKERTGLDLGSQAARDKKAVFWYEKAASQGFVRAQCNLAWLYENGCGGSDLGSQAARDKKAVFWYEQAAEKGYANAQNNLAWMYYEGRAGLDLGSPEARDKKAVFWYEQAAEQGVSAAQDALALMIKQGRAKAFIESEIQCIKGESLSCLAERLQKTYQAFPEVIFEASIRFLEVAARDQLLDESAFLAAFRSEHKNLPKISFFSRVSDGSSLSFQEIIKNAQSSPSSNTGKALLLVAKSEAEKFLKSKKQAPESALSASNEMAQQDGDLSPDAKEIAYDSPPPTYIEAIAAGAMNQIEQKQNAEQADAVNAVSYEPSAPAQSLIKGDEISLLPDLPDDPVHTESTSSAPATTADPFAGFSLLDHFMTSSALQKAEASNLTGNSLASLQKPEGEGATKHSFPEVSDEDLSTLMAGLEAEAAAEAAPEAPQGEININQEEDSREPAWLSL